MKTAIENWIAIILCLIVALFIGLKSCKPTNSIIEKGIPYKVVEIKRDTVYITKDTIVYKPILSAKIDTLYLPKYIDTNKVINDFYTIKTYSDTTLFDSSRIVINDSVTQNKIFGRKIDLSLKSRIITDSIFLAPKNKLNIYLGPNINPFNQSIGIQSNFQYGKFNINAGWNKNIIIGVGIKIK